jgi:hypothetical protein
VDLRDEDIRERGRGYGTFEKWHLSSLYIELAEEMRGWPC